MIRTLDDIMYITDGQDPFRIHKIYGWGGLGYKPTPYNMIGGTLTEDLNIIGLDKTVLEELPDDELINQLEENKVLIEEGLNKNLTDESKYDLEQLIKESENIENILSQRKEEEEEKHNAKEEKKRAKEEAKKKAEEEEIKRKAEEENKKKSEEENKKKSEEEVKEITKERKEQIDKFLNNFLGYYEKYKSYINTQKPDKYAKKFLKDKYETDKENFKNKINEQLEKIKNINNDEKKYLLEKNNQIINISKEQNFDLELPNVQIIDSEKINNDIKDTVFLKQINNTLVKEAHEMKNNISSYTYNDVKNVVSKSTWDKSPSDNTRLGFVNEAYLSKNTNLLPDGENENYKSTAQYDIYDFEGNTKFIELKTKLSTDVISNFNDFKDLWDIYQDEKKGKTNLIDFMEENKKNRLWIGLTVNKVNGGEGEKIPVFNEEGKIFKFVSTDRSQGSDFLNKPKDVEVLFITNRGSYTYDFTKDPNLKRKKYEDGYRYELPYPIINGEYQIPLMYLKEYKK